MIFQQRGWLAFGLGGSVALHAVVAFWLARAPSLEAPLPAGSRDSESIEFQVVPTAGREVPPPPPLRHRHSAPAHVSAPSASAPAGVPVAPPEPAPVAAPGPASAGAPGDVAGGHGPPAATGLLIARLSAAALRCYPQEAVRFRLSGEARLSFCLGEEGQASAVKLARSSGADALDRAALECVLPGALPLPGAAGCYELPVRFSTRGR